MMRAKVYKRGAYWWARADAPRIGMLMCEHFHTWGEAMAFALWSLQYMSGMPATVNRDILNFSLRREPVHSLDS